jgi:hypothetical protein
MTLDDLFCGLLGLMVLRVSPEGSLYSRRDGHGDRAIDAHRTTIYELLRLVLVRLTKQERRAFNIDPPKLEARRLHCPTDCRKMNHLLNLVLPKGVLEDAFVGEIAPYKDSSLLQQEIRLGMAFTSSHQAD